jgi:ribosome-binding factor A
MPKNIEQVNDLIREKLAHLIAKEIPLENGLITIVRVKTSPDLRYAKISLSVLPDNLSGTALKKVSSKNRLFAEILIKETKLRKAPRFHWVIDSTEKEAAEIEEVFKEIEAEGKK